METKKKIIRDVVHGYIKIDALTEKLINTYNFQRLKDIRQLTAQYVYPSATHNRFEHSLGVMHLAVQAFESLRPIFQGKGKTPEEIQSLDLHFQVAALLHDVGHAPFSHLGEYFFPPNHALHNAIQNKIRNIEYLKLHNVFAGGESNASKHELMSCYVILTKYYDILRQEFAKRHINLNIELVYRAIIGKTYKDVGTYWAENIIIRLLNSPTVDIDKLDYLMRDAYMTGASVPTIDTQRLLTNIQINKNTQTATFSPQALPVIQSIVEARDNMYLWVYNHHISVYTDFVIQYFIRHLIDNYEKDEDYRDKLNPQDFFSCEAIAERMVSDSDLWSILKRQLWSPCGEEEISPYTNIIVPQLLERRFLKPLWKTIYEFKHFMEEKVKDDLTREDFIDKLGASTPDYRVYIVNELRKRCDLSLGEIFIIPRSNKFYSLAPETAFTVYINGAEKKIDSLLPQKDYGKLYDKVAFYVFCREDKDKKNKVTQEFINLINEKPFPAIEELQGQSTQLKWEI